MYKLYCGSVHLKSKGEPLAEHFLVAERIITVHCLGCCVSLAIINSDGKQTRQYFYSLCYPHPYERYKEVQLGREVVDSLVY